MEDNLLPCDFYSTASRIDGLKAIRHPTHTDVAKLLEIIRSADYFERYFYLDFDNPNWLDMLKQYGVFENIKENRIVVDEKYTQYPVWWPGKYLVKVASKISDKVFAVIKKIETDNISALADCAQAILDMSPEFLKENAADIVSLFDRWLDLEYTGYIDDVAANLFKKYLSLEFFDEACIFLNILSKTKLVKPRGVHFRIEMYYYTDLVDKYMPKLIENKPIEVLHIVENRFRKALQSHNNKAQYSTFYRSTVENSSQTWRHDAKDLLFEILRDTLQIATKLKPEESKKIIAKYLTERRTIFERLAIHTARISKLDDIAVTLLTNKENLYRVDIYHEFALLTKERFGILNSEKKKQFIGWIMEGPKDIKNKDDTKMQQRIKFWQARWLLLIKEYFKQDDTLKEFEGMLNKYKDVFTKIDHPDLLSYTQTFAGPRSPLTENQLATMTPEQFIDWAKNKFPPPYDPIEGSPEGVARMLEGFIKQNPLPYAQNAEKFLDENLWPTYLSGLVQGLENAIKDGKVFDLEPVLRFIESPFKYRSEPEEKYDYFEVGKYTWLRRTIASFIESLVRKDEFTFAEDIMNRTQEVLVELIEKDEDPTPESEAKYGLEANNMDYVTYCMNSNRGQAMVALMHHALRRARMRSKEEKEKEKSKGSFPPGERMDLYKEFFTKRLDLELSPSVQSSYGQLLPYLFYLDQEWVKYMKQQDKLFPKSEEKNKFWEAHWQGYIGYNNFYNEIYNLIKEEYRKAVETMSEKKEEDKQRSHYDERLVQHLIKAFWRKLENIDDKESLLAKFFKAAQVELRARAIWFIADALKEVKPSRESEEWQRAKALWENRVEKVRDEELANFARWLQYCPENLDDMVSLIKPIIPQLQYGLQAEDVLNYINKNIESCTKNSLSLLNDYLKMKQASRSVLFRQELIKEILTKVHKYKDKPDIAKEINEAVNHLGIMGYYDFRELLV